MESIKQKEIFEPGANGEGKMTDKEKETITFCVLCGRRVTELLDDDVIGLCDRCYDCQDD